MSKRNDFVGFVGYRKQREPSFVQPAPFTSSWNPLFSVLIVFCVIFSGAAMLFSPFDDDMDNTYQVEFLKTMVSEKSRDSPALIGYESCIDLEDRLKTNVKDEMVTTVGLGYGGYGISPEFGMVDVAMDDGAALESADSSNSASTGSSSNQEFSGTNNQEQGVDEGDFVKTDGDFIYVLNDWDYQVYKNWGWSYESKSILHILAVPEFGQIENTSSTVIEGNAREMLLAGDRMIVYSDIYTWDIQEDHVLSDYVRSDGNYRVYEMTKMTILDISNRSSPQVDQEVYIEGNYQTAREVDGTVRMVSYAYLDIPDVLNYINYDYEVFWADTMTDSAREDMWRDAATSTIEHNNDVIDETSLSDLVPAIYFMNEGNLEEFNFATDGGSGCDNFVISSDGTGDGFTSILTIDLTKDNFSFEADHMMTNYPTIYSSSDTMVISENTNDWWWYMLDQTDYTEATNIHTFDVSEMGDTKYIASGRVDGTVSGQFSLSEYNEDIRVVSTIGEWNRWWLDNPEESETIVCVLRQVEGSHDLSEVGRVDGIALGERLWSARFVEEKAYLVTFRNIDPLWVIDLSNPTMPTIEGELEVPGVSTYIHPLDGDRLLTIGYGGDSEGLDWSTQISLFDVSDPNNPTLSTSLSLMPADENGGWSWGWSEANYEHKAFQYWNGTLAIPMSTYKYDCDEDGWRCTYEYVTKLVLIDVTDYNLELDGEIHHSDFYNEDNTYWNNIDVRRSIFMGDFVYSISKGVVLVHDLLDFEMKDSVNLGITSK